MCKKFAAADDSDGVVAGGDGGDGDNHKSEVESKADFPKKQFSQVHVPRVPELVILFYFFIIYIFMSVIR